MGAWIAVACIGTPLAWAQPPVPPDADVLVAQMERYISEIDSPGATAGLPWEEYVVLLYDRLHGREPTPREFAVLRGLYDETALRPSEALSLVLRGEEPCPSYEQVRTFLATKAAGGFRTSARVRAVAGRLADACARGEWQEQEDDELHRESPGAKGNLWEPDPPDLEYAVYFGYMHAHTGLSDGVGTPLEAYIHARDTGQLDFFALTDHGEFLLLWPWEDKWGQLVDAAEETNEPGRFVALYGFEWSNPLLGHVSVINASDFTDTLRTFPIRCLYRWLEARPEAIARFNHPGRDDPIGEEFRHFRLFPEAVPQMVGVEVWNRTNGLDVYHYPGSWTSPLSFLDFANRKRWRLGALGGQDNHDADWGIKSDFRTAVLAQALTREAVLDAYRHRRFYATEDPDLELDFRCAGYPMGSRVQDAPREFRVTASDRSGDVFEEVRFYRNGELLEARAVEGTSVDETFEDAVADSDDGAADREAYYYVIVRQTDDNDQNGRNDEAISSPIWTGPPTPRPPGCAGAYAGDHAAAIDLRGDGSCALLVLALLGWRKRRCRLHE